jgi:serine/threonine protein kinase
VIAGRYTLEREIGRGGSGTVHLARDEVLGRTVAVKRIGILPGEHAALGRAGREARLAAALNHPHVVSVFDLVEEEDVHWLVMEYVDGRTISEMVRADGPLEVAEAAAYLAQTADALADAHEAGIVHRDVKPSNILVSDGVAKLSDFGIAKSADDASLTQTGLVTGSPAYLAPEVASGSSATPASDVWSLGATLYHAVTGRPPYEVGDNLIGALYKIVHEDPPRLPDDHPMAGLLSVMMTREPENRWPMHQVRDQLMRLARGQRATVTATAAPRVNGERTGELPTVRTAAPAVVPDGPRRSRAPYAWIGLAAVLAIAAVVAAYVWAGRGTPEAAEGDTPTSPTTSESTTTSTAPPLSAKDTREQMDAFITSYLSMVTTNPRQAFDQLTPEFQKASGGFDGYMGWWGKVRSATLADVRSDPSDLTVGYTVDYVFTSGARDTQDVRLQLQRLDDRYLIAGEG